MHWEGTKMVNDQFVFFFYNSQSIPHCWWGSRPPMTGCLIRWSYLDLKSQDVNWRMQDVNQKSKHISANLGKSRKMNCTAFPRLDWLPCDIVGQGKSTPTTKREEEQFFQCILISSRCHVKDPDCSCLHPSWTYEANCFSQAKLHGGCDLFIYHVVTAGRGSHVWLLITKGNKHKIK